MSEMQQRIQEICESHDKTTRNIDELWDRYLESGLEYRYKRPSPIRSSQMEYARYWLRDYETDYVFRNHMAAWLDILFTLHMYRDSLQTHDIARDVQRFLMKLAESNALDPRLCLMLLGWDEYDLLERQEQDRIARLIAKNIPRVKDRVVLYIFFSSFNDRLRAFAHLPEKYLIAQYHMSAIQIASGMEITESRVNWVRRAAQEGYPAACCFLSVLHRKGLGPVGRDVFQEVRWLLRGASLMHDASMILLAQCFETGKGVLCNQSMAVRLVRRTIEFSRNSQAMFALSNYYRDGVVELNEEDLSEADSGEHSDVADERASEDIPSSNQTANRRAADFLEGSPVGTKHPHIKKSFQWCLLAASYANADAQMELGFKYLRGEGCEASELRAWEWIARAARGGNVVANHFVEERESGLMRGNM